MQKGIGQRYQLRYYDEREVHFENGFRSLGDRRHFHDVKDISGEGEQQVRTYGQISASRTCIAGFIR